MRTEKMRKDLLIEISPGDVVDKDKLAIFPCQLVCEAYSFGRKVTAIWIHRFQHRQNILGTKSCKVLISGQENPTAS